MATDTATLLVIDMGNGRLEPVFDRIDRVALICKAKGWTAGIYPGGACHPVAIIGADGTIARVS